MKRWLRSVWPFGWTGVSVVLVALSSFLVATHELGAWPWIDRRPLRERYLFRYVSRTDLNPVLNAPGRLESSKRTVIRCEVSNLGGTMRGAATTILTLLPEGSQVKKGDVLATFDASTFEEMLRQQLITVEQARASLLQVQLNHEIALLAVHEYREGTVEETVKGMEGSIALARSDLSRAKDHLTWTERMNGKGYASPAQIVSEKHGVAQLELALSQKITSLELFQRFSLPKTEKNLQGQVKSAETSLGNETLRLQRQLDRLERYQLQVDRCTIRAPHDGVLFYYKEPNPRGQTALIDEGTAVRQRQALFYLPDLSEMEVQTAVNESVVNQIIPGQRVSTTFEALPNVILTGRAVSISQIPTRVEVRNAEDMMQPPMDTGVRFFTVIVKLDSVTDQLKPGMTTMVDFRLSRRQNVLAIPHQAIRSDGGKKVCYVAHDESLERRVVKIGQDTVDMVEVLEGLQEGEMVALNPPGTASHVEQLVSFDESDPGQTGDTESVTTSQQ
jgi:HlyD family secretion protein